MCRWIFIPILWKLFQIFNFHWLLILHNSTCSVKWKFHYNVILSASQSLSLSVSLCRLTQKTFSLYAVVLLLTWKKQSQKGHITLPIKSMNNIWFLFLLELKIFGNASQTSWFFYWVWCSCTCKHEDRQCYKCCCDVILTRNCKLNSGLFFLIVLVCFSVPACRDSSLSLEQHCTCWREHIPVSHCPASYMLEGNYTMLV